MPIYEFVCEGCAETGLARLPVEERDMEAICPACEGVMRRRFTPTANLVIPAHFQYLARWCLPDKSDTAAWDARQNPSQAHIRPPDGPTLKDHLMEDFLGRERIRLSDG